MYLLYTTSFVTLEEVRNYKSLQSYRYFKAGWVIDVRWKKFKEVTLILGKVRHSYSSKEPLRPWVLLQSNGSVVCGHCTCMAGQGETCSHVGSILYWLETHVRIREETTCTSKENTWMMPTAVKDIPFLMLKEIDFTYTSAEKRMKYSEKECEVPLLQSQVKPPNDEEWSSFFKEIAKETEKKPAILSIIPPHNKQFVQSSDHLPLPLQTIFDPKNLEFDYLQLLGIAKDFISPTISTTQQDHLEELTRSQSNSKARYKYRAGRITAC